MHNWRRVSAAIITANKVLFYSLVLEELYYLRPSGDRQQHQHLSALEHIKTVINCAKNATFLLHVGHLSTKSLLY